MPLDLRPSERTFERQHPFDDEREVVVRRGGELGHSYGLELGRRHATVGGREVDVVRYLVILSPPPLTPGVPPLGPDAAERYKPEYEVLYAPGAEVLIRRAPDGFTDAEVEAMLATARSS